MRVLDDDGNECPPGVAGEIYMRPAPGGRPTYRYIGSTAKSRDGWDSLGDLGYFDAEGFLYLNDRRVDMFTVGGRNVYPAEIESALAEHPHVLSSLAVGVPDGDLGQVPAAVETVVYFAVAEALTNVARHSGASAATVRLRHERDRMHVEVADDGRGGADEDTGSGLTGIRRRVEAHDGTFALTSPAGGPTTLRVSLPCGS